MGGRWFAWRGGGAWAAGPLAGVDAGGRRRAASTPRASTELDDAQIVYANAQELATSARTPGFAALIEEAWRERGFGEFWGYSLVAEGSAEVMVELGLKIWDVAAPAVLVEEAGGRITDFEGRRVFDGGNDPGDERGPP